MLRITSYADRLLEGLDTVDYLDRIKASQINWIGRSEGADVIFETTAEQSLTVYTTRPDTLFGATYMVMAPDHEYVTQWMEQGLIKNRDEVEAYRVEAQLKSDFERTEINKEKSGVRLDGVEAVNPANEQTIPIYIADYVLASYGTGAIMAVPAHDTRDYEFAQAFNLPIVEVVAGGDISQGAFDDEENGILINSGFLDGLKVPEAKALMIERLEAANKGQSQVNYRLRDWVFSRQRYWGEPIPIVHCASCGMAPLSEDDLPLELPQVDNIETNEEGESPLASVRSWVETSCPTCGGPAERETDTMPQWAGSSWYYLRFLDPHNDEALASPEAISYWMPVDWYNGGMEHTTLHLLYSRFWYKFLYDIGVVPQEEPYTKRTSHGFILGENSEKMSKSRGNVVNPDDIVREYGADTLRIYEMFIGDFEKAATWNTNSIKGSLRFLERVWALQDMLVPNSAGQGYRPELVTITHQTIKKVSYDIEHLKGNTAVAQLMTYINTIYDVGSIAEDEYKTFLILLNPLAPHITEEIWDAQGYGGQVVDQTWPSYEEALTVEDEVEIAVQINGKLRSRLTLATDAPQKDAVQQALALPELQSYLAGKTIRKEIYVPNRLLNIVVG